MRLREIQNIINTNYKGLDTLTFQDSPHKDYKILNNYQPFQQSMKNLSEIEIFKEKISNILSGELEGHSSNTVKINPQKAQTAMRAINILKQEIKLLKNVLDNLLEEQNKLTLSIKLHNFENFKDFSSFCNNFNKKVLAPVGRLQEDITIGDFEIGSRWINIVFQTTLGLALITHIFRSSFDILIHDYEKYRIVNEMVESFERENDRLEEFNKFIQKDKEKLFYTKTDEIITDLKENHDLNINEEELNELKNSIKLSMEESHRLLDKGLEIYQALDIPQEERYELPNYKELIPFLSDNKLLANDKE